MKLPKDARAAIYEANGKPVEIEIPPGEQCRRWQVYAIEGNRRRRRRRLDPDALFTRPMFFVVSHERRGDSLFAVVRLVDPAVYLARQAGRAHPEQYTGSIPDAIDDAECVPREYQERLSIRGRQQTTLLGAKGREQRKEGRANQDIADAEKKGAPTALAEGRRDRSRRRQAASVAAPVRERSSTPPEPEPPPVPVAAVLQALRSGDSAQDVARRLGRPVTKLRGIIAALQQARAQGLVFYYVEADDEGDMPVGRWAHRKAGDLQQAV